MKRFVPREKLGKKARKQLDSEQRATWAFSPVTKKVESNKMYNRKRKSHDRYDDYGMGFLLLWNTDEPRLFKPRSQNTARAIGVQPRFIHRKQIPLRIIPAHEAMALVRIRIVCLLPLAGLIPLRVVDRVELQPHAAALSGVQLQRKGLVPLWSQ